MEKGHMNLLEDIMNRSSNDIDYSIEELELMTF